MQRNFVLDMTNFSTNLVLNEPRETRTSGDSQLKCAVRLRSTLACPRPRPRRQSKPPYWCATDIRQIFHREFLRVANKIQPCCNE